MVVVEQGDGGNGGCGVGDGWSKDMGWMTSGSMRLDGLYLVLSSRAAMTIDERMCRT